MRRDEQFLLREAAGMLLIVPVGEAMERFQGMLTVNETGAFLWGRLAEEQTAASLAQALTEEYEVDDARARADTEAFLKSLRSVGALCGE